MERAPEALVGFFRALGTSGKATMAWWIKNQSTYEKEVRQATAMSGTKGKKKAMKKLSVSAGRVAPPRSPDPEGLAFRRTYI